MIPLQSFYISDDTDIQALAVCSEPCFSECLFKQELGKTCKKRFQQEVIGKKYIYVRSMINFSTLILHKNKKRQWSFWLQSMKHFYLHMYKYEWRGQPFSVCVSCVFPQIYDAEGTLQHFIDGNDPTKSSWMRYIRCARHCGEQNMMVVQYR